MVSWRFLANDLVTSMGEQIVTARLNASKLSGAAFLSQHKNKRFPELPSNQCFVAVEGGVWASARETTYDGIPPHLSSAENPLTLGSTDIVRMVCMGI